MQYKDVLTAGKSQGYERKKTLLAMQNLNDSEMKVVQISKLGSQPDSQHISRNEEQWRKRGAGWLPIRHV